MTKPLATTMSQPLRCDHKLCHSEKNYEGNRNFMIIDNGVR